MAPGLVQRFSAHPANAGTYSWTKRNYYLRLPKGYNPDMPVAIDMAGVGCGGDAMSGSNGDYTVPPLAPGGVGQTTTLQVGFVVIVSRRIRWYAGRSGQPALPGPMAE